MEEYKNPFDDDPETRDIGDESKYSYYLDHTTRVHLQHAKLSKLISEKEHWIFAMTADCALIAAELAKLHVERCNSTIEMVFLCCLDSNPAFFAFPKSHMKFDEIESVVGLEMSGTKEELESRPFFTISMNDPKPLRNDLNGWFKKDHMVN